MQEDKKMNIENVPKRFKIMLSNLDMTQKDLSDKTGIREADVSYYCNGHRCPSALALIKIANATRVSPSWILGYGSDENMERM